MVRRIPAVGYLFIGFILVTVVPLRVAAQPADEPAIASIGDQAQVKALKARGDRAMDALRYGDALTAYKQAYSLSKNPALLYNQARAYQALGNFGSALTFLEKFEADAPANLRAKVPKLQELIDEIKARVTTLTIRCNVPGARVILGDKVIGTTPIAKDVKAASGEVILQVTAERYRPFKRLLLLKGGTSKVVEIELLPKNTSGVLVIQTNVAGSDVWVDGKPVGKAPAEAVVRSGTHRIKISRPGYETAETSAVLRVGERKKVAIPLAKKSPITAKWWFWTGIGVVVAGGVATAIILTRERSPDEGTISPGRISGPLVSF